MIFELNSLNGYFSLDSSSIRSIELNDVDQSKSLISNSDQQKKNGNGALPNTSQTSTPKIRNQGCHP
ncbi:hypothetical protein L6452_18417 [Arctium lappa]|uniref:Uncharacterized protein n=1 Tax=Arctium lappa TaxID=4217 RepID=A0ACB9C5Z2_ARCLA|nr:hypothetical protein L6452_18417 [Arctium lappa]